jgi:hypothetical protein
MSLASVTISLAPILVACPGNSCFLHCASPDLAGLARWRPVVARLFP